VTFLTGSFCQCSLLYRIPFKGHHKGCSDGFDTNDYDFVTNGGTEDGYAAIKAALEHVDTLTTIDGYPLSNCDKISNFLIFVSTFFLKKIAKMWT